MVASSENIGLDLAEVTLDVLTYNAESGGNPWTACQRHCRNPLLQHSPSSLSGAVNTGTTPNVKYGYADGTAGTVRPTSMTYPNGRVLTFSYGAWEAMNDRLSRIESLIDNDGTRLADYTRLGIDRTVEVTSPQPS